MLGLLIVVCLLSVAVYYAVLYWPPRERKPRSADEDKDLRRGHRRARRGSISIQSDEIG
ncbi:hypothetical protein IRT45_14265 [Nocardia sp. BSTN01]|uniref:hypothetical protein n=1 Tax=Nocardia sp. BSTN01 TaxID=2783665 RepID=UPI001890122E|nr:hypothetical protein [Nocardia sp. BSTN01]MBF4998316.1 hypothetical protein [Nocardia sp. BSTN01]